MNRSVWALFNVMVVVAMSFAVACDSGNARDPIPESKHPAVPRAWTPEQVDALVKMEQVSIFSPAPRENGTPPEACDDIRFLRFKLRSMPEDASRADAALIMIPGVVEGANGFEHIARQMIYIAKTQYDKSFEVWAFDRRNNCLEDTTGIDAAEQAASIDAAEKVFIDYYYNGKAIDGKVFQGFLKSRDMPYVSEFGLKMDTEDIYKIITTMIPDPEIRRKKVFVGGHSLGGMHTSMFAGWDFDGDPTTTDDAGYRNCAGIFALDSTLTSMTDFDLSNLIPGASGDLSQKAYEKNVSRIRENKIIRVIPFLDGEVGALMEAVGFLAHSAPDAEATAVKNVPYSKNVDLLNKIFHSRTTARFLTGADDIKKLRYTNEALLGVLFDDDYAPAGMIQVSMGFLNGAPVVEKNFPLMEGLEKLPKIWELLTSFTGDAQLYIAAESGRRAPLYTWANFDEVGTAADPDYQSTDGSLTYTTISDVVSDIQDFARALHIGPSNLIEWYFSTRRLVDLLAAGQPFGPAYGLNLMHAEQIAKLPQIEFPAEDSMMHLSDSKYPLLPGFNHMDPMFAAVDRPDFKSNRVIKPLIEFVLANAGN